MIVIKDIKMPSSCYDCLFAKNKKTNDYGSFCECGVLEDYETINLLEHSKHPNCPLVEQEPILDKIRAEIMDLEEELFHRPNTDYTDYAAVRHCVEIIDKYKTESEE